MIPRLKNVAYEDRLKDLKLWSLEDHRIRADLIVFKITHGLSSLTVDTFFVFDTDSRTRGHPWKLKKRRTNTDLRYHFFRSGLSTGGTNWTVQQFVLLQSTVSRADYKECG